MSEELYESIDRLLMDETEFLEEANRGERERLAKDPSELSRIVNISRYNKRVHVKNDGAEVYQSLNPRKLIANLRKRADEINKEIELTKDKFHKTGSESVKTSLITKIKNLFVSARSIDNEVDDADFKQFKSDIAELVGEFNNIGKYLKSLGAYEATSKIDTTLPQFLQKIKPYGSAYDVNKKDARTTSSLTKYFLGIGMNQDQISDVLGYMRRKGYFDLPR